MTQPQVADQPGSGPTRAGAHDTGTGLDAPVAGAALVLTLYGLTVIVAELLFGVELVPPSGLGVAGIMVGCLLVGAVLGGGAARAATRR